MTTKMTLIFLKSGFSLKSATCMMPEDSRDWMMVVAWPSLQPVTVERVPMEFIKSWGLIELI